MRENEIRIGGLQWGLFSIFEPSEPKRGRVIDQSVAAWRIASQKTGGSAFENPRSSVQRSFSMVAGGSNRAYDQPVEQQYCFSPYAFSPPDPDRMVPVIYRRIRCNPALNAAPPYDPEQLRNSTATQVNEREMNRRMGYRYPTPEEVAEIQRRFYNPELVEAMELAQREYLAQMGQILSEPAPPPGLSNCLHYAD